MSKIIPLTVIAFILTGALLCSCDSKIIDNDPCDTCQNSCDTCLPCDTCDTTLPCDTCDTTKPDPDSLAHAFTWTETTIPGEVNVSGVMIISENPLRIYALYNNLYEYDGSSWEVVPIRASGNPLGHMADMKMFGFGRPSDYWIVYGGLAFHINDDIYGVRYEPPTDGFLNACWGTSSTDMFFVGNYGAVTHFDGTNWTKMPRVTNDHLTSVWGTSHNDVWAGGFSSSTAESVLLHYDGSSWQEIDLSTVGWIGVGKHSLRNVWTCDSAGRKIVIASGSNIWRRTGNGAWRSDSSFLPNALPGGGFVGLGIRGNNANDLLAAGGWGWVGHWNGKTWKRYDELFNYGNPSYGASALDIKGNTACVVGTKSGKSWIAIGRRKQ